MSHKVIASLLAGLLLLVACPALGIAHYLPRSELIAGFRTIFGAFTATATGLIILTAILIGLTLVGLFLWAMGYAQQAWRILVANAKQREALAATAAAEALRAQREAELQVTVTPPGHQILVHQVAGNLEISHTPLHLAPGRVNDLPAPLSPEEARRWHFHTLANATARKGAGLSAETRPQLPSPETPLPDRVDLGYYQFSCVNGTSVNF